MAEISMFSEDHIIHVNGGKTQSNSTSHAEVDCGIAVVCGLALMVMIYSVGHISGGHLDPAVTIAFAVIKRFLWKQVPAYTAVQVAEATLAKGTLSLFFNGFWVPFCGNSSFWVPFCKLLWLNLLLHFFLKSVVCGVATDNRAIGELAGLAVGSTSLLNVLFAGPISGSSMNPATCLGSAIVWNKYTGMWIYLTAPVSGCICDAWAKSLIRFTQNPAREINKSGSFLKGFGLN